MRVAVLAIAPFVFPFAIAALFGKPDFGALTFTVNQSVFRYGDFINAVITFVLVAAAAWCVIRPGARGPATGWMLAGAGVLALANAAAYTTLLFDPLIVALALLTSLWTSRGLLAARRAGTVLVGTAALLGLAVAADRSDYLGGFERTMVTRVAGSASAQSVLGQSWYWAGLLLLLAVRPAAADKIDDLARALEAAEAVADLAEDQPVEDRVLQAMAAPVLAPRRLRQRAIGASTGARRRSRSAISQSDFTPRGGLSTLITAVWNRKTAGSRKSGKR